jgi:hypothetical protein
MKLHWIRKPDIRELEEGVLYTCQECGFAGLTRNTARWKLGTIVEAGDAGVIDGASKSRFYSRTMGEVLVCADERDCWRRKREVV